MIPENKQTTKKKKKKKNLFSNKQSGAMQHRNLLNE
jgi:hypothetical protein